MLTLLFVANAASPTNEEVKSSAIAKGKLAANYWVKNSGINPSTTNYYADICSFYGACLLGDALNDSTYYKDINSRYTRTQAISTANIDENSCGILPLHLYLHNKKDQQLKLGIAAADASIQKKGYPRNAIDDTYMTGSLHIQAYKASKDKKYLDFFADYMITYQKNLQQSNGLYWHHKDLSHQFWGRGNGWGAASAAELIRVLPENHPQYNDFISNYKKHMKGLLDAQMESGMWPQLLLSTDSRNWQESSGTAMFVFALFTGLELGILDNDTYLEPAKKGWMALKEYLDASGKLTNIAAGFWPKVGDANEYLTASKAAAGNSHGTAGLIWAATAIVNYYNHLAAVSVKPLQENAAKITLYSSHSVRYFDLNGRTIPAFPRSVSKGSAFRPGLVIQNSDDVNNRMMNIR